MTLGFFYIDPLYFLFLIPAMVIAFGAQVLLKSRVSRMSQIMARAGITGAQCAQRILEYNGIHDVRVEEVGGFLSDHYSPREKVLRLSPDIYRGRSITSLGVAAHEVGHAIQDAQAYAPLVLRQTIAPVAAIGSNLALLLVPIGIFLAWAQLVFWGIVVFSIAVFFTLITLPVEFDASRRAKEQLLAMGLTSGEEAVLVSKVLNAAALTYVAAAATAIAQLLYFIVRYQMMTRDD